MLSNALRYLLVFAVLLTSNSQALMAWQSVMSATAKESHSAASSVVITLTSEAEADLPACHQMLRNKAAQAVQTLTLECERDCNCCGGSCSVFAMTLDLPQALPAKQSPRVFMLSVVPLIAQSELAIRPPIFA